MHHYFSFYIQTPFLKRGALFCTLCLFFMGCSDPFSPIWLVNKEKVISIEADKPWGMPGTQVHLTAHLGNQAGPVNNATQNILWQMCGGDISKTLKGDVNCTQVLEDRQAGTSVDFILPDLFSEVSLEGKALINALAGYPIWVKLTWQLEEKSVVAIRRLWLFPSEPAHALDVRYNEELLEQHQNWWTDVEFQLKDTQDEVIVDTLQPGEDYTLSVLVGEINETPMKRLAFKDETQNWDNDQLVSSLNLDNVTEWLVHQESCVEPRWLIFTTDGNFQHGEQSVLAAQTECDRLPDLIEKEENIFHLDSESEAEEITLWLVFEDGFGGLGFTFRTFLVQSSEG